MHFNRYKLSFWLCWGDLCILSKGILTSKISVTYICTYLLKIDVSRILFSVSRYWSKPKQCYLYPYNLQPFLCKIIAGKRKQESWDFFTSNFCYINFPITHHISYHGMVFWWQWCFPSTSVAWLIWQLIPQRLLIDHFYLKYPVWSWSNDELPVWLS